jgi:hypothetical protein
VRVAETLWRATRQHLTEFSSSLRIKWFDAQPVARSPSPGPTLYWESIDKSIAWKPLTAPKGTQLPMQANSVTFVSKRPTPDANALGEH